MDPSNRRETHDPVPGEDRLETPDARDVGNAATDVDDSALAAWLTARETELDEQAWAEADQFGEERWSW